MTAADVFTIACVPWLVFGTACAAMWFVSAELIYRSAQRYIAGDSVEGDRLKARAEHWASLPDQTLGRVFTLISQLPPRLHRR